MLYASLSLFPEIFAQMYLISYICSMKEDDAIRELYFSEEFWEFYSLQSEIVKKKFEYVFGIVRKEKVITTKFIKHLVDTDLYEMRVSVGTNEYRTVLFAINHSNIMLASKILVLNAFLKKSSKDYNKEIKKAIKILGGFQL